MEILIVYFVSIFVLINFTLKKNNFFLNKPIKKHKKLLPGKNIPISGGLFILIVVVFFTNINIELKIISASLYMVGLFSDLDILESPLKRFVLQVVLIVFYLFLSKNYLVDLRIHQVNNLFENNYYIAILFTAFCFLVLINGTNFIDGINGLTGSYYLYILIIFLLFYEDMNIELNLTFVKILILALIVFIFNNFFSKSLLGDGGAYLIAFIIGAFLIDLYLKNPLISPYFITLLLWYPVYENLFSIIRKKFLKQKATAPDNDHLHQLVYFFLKKKFKYANNITGITLSFINLLIFLIGVNFYNKTNILVIFILINVLIYSSVYIFLYYKKNNIKFF